MDAAECDGAACVPVSAAIHANMVRSAHEAGWEALAGRMLPESVEQEGIKVRLPGSMSPATPV